MSSRTFALLLVAGLSITPALAAPPAKAGLSPAERIAVFKAAGAVQRGGKWLMCADQPNPGGATIETVSDLNGDGRPEAVVTEGGTFCYGSAEMGYALLSKQATGAWKLIDGGSGIPNFLATKSGGWPDMEIGGPGFCFPVQRWNGKAYALNRFQYEGKRCQPNR
jgi:hypothetical protein